MKLISSIVLPLCNRVHIQLTHTFHHQITYYYDCLRCGSGVTDHLSHAWS
eukprot:m.1532834 g.1532834  ORF g.1532834 m.1532834 type:complete len:50 (+) comp25241_c0_seq28:1256-1405(+)